MTVAYGTPEYPFRPGQTVWVWWEYELRLRKATVIDFSYHSLKYGSTLDQLWTVTTERSDRPKGLRAQGDKMYATREEAVIESRKWLSNSIGMFERILEGYKEALKILDE